MLHVVESKPNEMKVRDESNRLVATFYRSGWSGHRLDAATAAAQFVAERNRSNRIFGKLKSKLDELE